MMDYYQANVYLSSTKISELDKNQRVRTGGSSKSLDGREKKRITASACGQIAKRATTKVAGLVKTLLYSTFRGNTATQWGSFR